MRRAVLVVPFVVFALALARLVALDNESPQRASRGPQASTGMAGREQSAVPGDHPTPASASEEPPADEPEHRPFSLALWLDDGSGGAWILLHSETAGEFSVTFRPRGRPDVDLMGTGGAAEPGSLACRFKIGPRTYEGGVEWDGSMRPVSFHFRTDKESEGDLVTERHEIDGQAYVLERRRVYEADRIVDVGLELKRAP